VGRRLFGKEHAMKVLERHLRKIHPGKWGEVEGLDNKYDAVERRYGFPPKRYYRSFIGTHDINTSIMEREWESLATMEAAQEKALADPEWQALTPEFEAIMESLQIELYWVQS
jgi:NIPSNAP